MMTMQKALETVGSAVPATNKKHLEALYHFFEKKT